MITSFGSAEDAIKVTANSRSEHKKSDVRRLRGKGQIPAVAYGKQLPTQQISVAPDAVRAVLSSAWGRNTVVNLEVDGKDKLTVLLREY